MLPCGPCGSPALRSNGANLRRTLVRFDTTRSRETSGRSFPPGRVPLWGALASDSSERRAFDRITCVPGAPVEGGLRGATHTNPGLPGVVAVWLSSRKAERPGLRCRVVVSRRASSPPCGAFGRCRMEPSQGWLVAWGNPSREPRTQRMASRPQGREVVAAVSDMRACPY